ncbi:putative CorA-like magnesium transporter [Actinoplanes missouriensis 431]|uniref:Putative CorA-like magnesium transporter n=1 Tax=Actinoplanes missouriensis (strain ATCC 14538 / DSM 43046 / CBS 188.64 / JCM 3121 / NBRC 102363 / NCIMB 12654 / NRRL B-3342 / UNCC 431) TaxID=512565 RepID=I0HFD2_ACTM4|nr:magnesium transporter CorA family protein [Actinoplanes missouriensis]BAL91719.1 putative CorA-like magnesium transporter [Actinoplanes missouriensis 431]
MSETPFRTRLYAHGHVVAEDFPVAETGERLRAAPDAVAWIDLLNPDQAALQTVADAFHLHPLAVEDALQQHERPKLERYDKHLFMNVYAVRLEDRTAHKVEISAFVTERALITVHKAPGDVDVLVRRWDADIELGASGGVNFLVYGLLDTVVDSQQKVARTLDEAMDQAEDALLEEGGAPRSVRLYGFALRKALSALRRAVAPMPDVVRRAVQADIGHGAEESARAGDPADGERLRPYYRDVEDHAQQTFELIEHSLTRINELLDADLAEQSNVLNEVTRKLAAWAAIIAVPTALTGYFGQNLPYPGYEQPWGFVISTVLIVVSAAGLYVFLRKRGWL